MSKTNFEHAKSEAVLKEAAMEFETEFYCEAAKKFGDSEYEFSAEHEEKMKKLFAKQKKKPWQVLKWVSTAAAMLIVCFTAAMQVEAFAEPVKEMLFAHDTVTVTEERRFDVYHPEYLGPPVSSFVANVTFEFNGQNAKVISCEFIKVTTEEVSLEIEYSINSNTVEISYVCRDIRDMETIQAENPDMEYTEAFEEWVGVELVRETLTLKVLPDGNINGFV